MEDVEKIARALRELGKIEDEKEAKREEERKHKKEVEGRPTVLGNSIMNKRLLFHFIYPHTPHC